MPTLRRVQWTGDDNAWKAICEMHAESELVAFRESNGTISVETPDGRRVAARVGDWIVQDVGGFHIESA